LLAAFRGQECPRHTFGIRCALFGVKGKGHCAIGVVPTPAQRTREDAGALARVTVNRYPTFRAMVMVFRYNVGSWRARREGRWPEAKFFPR
jgi:hypothetical protein